MSATTENINSEPLPNLEPLRTQIADSGYELTLTDKSIRNVQSCGFRGGNLNLALVAVNMLIDEHPTTLRGWMYRVVSAGWLPSTDNKHYRRIGRIATRLREEGVVPFSWLVDGVRSTQKPSSWAGLDDYADVVAESYRKDFWAGMDDYIHVIVEKDAMAGVLSPITREYDVALSPIRGYSSLSFAHEIASTWNKVDKPIYCYFLGDFDPSGFDLERDIKDKLDRYTTGCEVHWIRLGVNVEDFEEFDLLPLKTKPGDKRAAAFIQEHGSQCAELDAIPSSAIRQRLRDAIESHIPHEEWEKLKEVERTEKETFKATLKKLGA
ncbi:toprim domain-containing protein [Thalassoglobus polymorphus]|uniref:Uncharacterized protein n=1 Tax=Thalassoglobus polymorphus TaxID=2527994 RepID=A0A517QR27_9PLAN|nr:hypothetical protein [Thalassoglobus polymorphus]QDT34084.1 hypothetical protein Mal48_33440 [Thalassoglobus polymorphus]